MQIIESLIIIIVLVAVILIGSKIKSKNAFNVDYLSLENSSILRGALSLMIIIYHLSGRTEHTTLLNAFSQIGYLIVAIFFFLSGYGLYFGYKNKANYMNGFLLKRLPSVLIPYIIATMVHGLCAIYLDANVKVGDFFLSLFGIKMFDETTWYICVQVVLYIIFYFAFRFFKEKSSYVMFTVLFIGVMTVFLLLPLEDKWARSLVAFPLGIIWYENKEKIDKIIRNKYILSLILSGFLFVVTCGIKLLGVIIDNEIIIFIGNSLSSIMICIFAFVVLNKVSINNKILAWLGKYSLELYLFHNVILRLLGRIDFIHNDTALYTVSVFAVTIIVALVIAPINKLLIKEFNKLFNKKVKA